VRAGLIATLLALATLSAPSVRASEPRAILDRFLARAAATPLGDLTVEQDLTLFNPDGRTPSATGTQRIVFKLPDRQRIEQTVDGRTEVRVTVAGRTWRRGPDGAVAAVPARRASGLTLAVPARRSATEVLAEWRALGVRDERFHEARLGGRPVTVVGAYGGERDRPAVWLDAEYGVVRFVALEPADRAATLTDFVFSDHRVLAGTLYFPHRQEVFRGGKLIVRALVRSAAVNTAPSDALFDPGALGAR
jgi:hypothetical protein